jgi:hypothetical protein
MDVAGLVDQLGSHVDADRKVAAQALVDAGQIAVGPVLAALCDESSAVEWSTSAVVLRRIGDDAFGPLVDALVAAPTAEVARRCGWTLNGLEVSDNAIYVPALGHPSAAVRATAAYAFHRLKEQAELYLPVLAGLLDDPDANVRQRVIWVFGEIGPVSLPLLHQIRRGGGRRRRAALVALAEIGGWDALKEADRRAVARLIEVKSVSEVPAPMHLCGSWYALPTADQAAVLDAFDLIGPRPVTMRLGESAWNYDHHNWSSREHRACRRAYVTPCLDGWTLVFGRLPTVAHAPDDEYETVLRDDVLNRCTELSARFGAAHWYGASCGDGWTAWCIAEAGTVIRYYDVEDPDDQIGETHPAEAGYVLPHENPFPDDAFDGVPVGSADAFTARYQQVKRELNNPDDAHATAVAARASVDPAALGLHTTVAGRPVIALTTCGATMASAPGALEI